MLPEQAEDEAALPVVLSRGRLIPTGTHSRERSSLKRPWATAVISLFSLSLLDALARGFL